MTDNDLQRLADKDQIRDVMLRYARGVDRRDWELVRSVFFEDADDDHADFKGKRDAFIAWLRQRHDVADFLKSTHLLANCLVEFAAHDVAAVETYFVAKLELGPDAGGHRAMLDAKHADSRQHVRMEILGRYVDRFEKRGGEWRVARRHTVFDAIQSQLAAAGDDALNPVWTLGMRDHSDPVFAVREEAGVR